MLRFRFLSLIFLLTALLFSAVTPVFAQDGAPGGLTISTAYPSMVIGLGETVSISFDVRSPSSQTVALDVADLPKDWTAEFRGGGRVIRSVYVAQGEASKVELRVTPADNAKAGNYKFKVTAQGSGARTEFPVELIVREKLPAQLAFETESPIVRGGSDANFRFSVTLKNDGDEDITVNFITDAPREFAVKIQSAGKDITDLPMDIKAASSQKIDISAEPLTLPAVGTYPITVTAQSEKLNASVALTAEVIGQPQLTLTTPDGRLSDTAILGRANPIKLVLRNSGNSPAAGVKLTVSAPAGWTVNLDPAEVIEVPANDEVEVTANIKPADKAIAGDYMLTFRAQPRESSSKSADFRVTVQTSTLWGAVGIALIGVAVVIVGMAVVRFGRR